eukprot:scaffold15022_cov117-Isochrysis_galbana.AAC.16
MASRRGRLSCKTKVKETRRSRPRLPWRTAGGAGAAAAAHAAEDGSGGETLYGGRWRGGSRELGNRPLVGGGGGGGSGAGGNTECTRSSGLPSPASGMAELGASNEVLDERGGFSRADRLLMGARGCTSTSSIRLVAICT